MTVAAGMADLRNKAVHRDLIEAVARKLSELGLDADALGQLQKVDYKSTNWQGMHKNADNEAVITDLGGSGVRLVFAPTWDIGPAWPAVQPARAVTVKVPKTTLAARTDNRKTALIIPDAQYPYQDDEALDAVMRIAEHIRPDRVIWLGDNLDFSELSRFTMEQRFQRSTQPALDALHMRLAVFKTLGAQQDYIEGNHEFRLGKFILANAAAAFGLRQANTPQSWPVLSIEHLLRLDELGVTYHPGYPAGEVWLNDRLRCIHGHKHRGAKHSTAAAYAQESHVSTIFGHLHRVDVAYRTHRVRGGAETVMAACPGAMCKIDGTVPGYGSGFDSRGNTIPTADPWQHGCAIVTYEEEGIMQFAYEHAAIEHGEALFRGRVL